jgi:antiviral helicase SKI2
VRGAPPAEQQKKLPCAATFAPIALHLHALASRCIAHGQYSSLPSLSFVDRHEALPSSSSAGAATQVGRAQLPLLDVPKETRVQSIEAVEAQLRVARGHTFEHLAWMFLSPQHAPLLQRRFTLAHSLAKAKTRAAACRHYASAANLALFPDYQQRLAVLRMLEYVDRCDETVTLKGRVACEMNTCNELLASEAIFNNVLEPLSPTEAAALLSALVFQEKGDEDDLRLTPRMETAKEQMRDILTVITELQDAEGVVVNEDLRPALNFGAAAVVYAWARGDPFKDITAMTGIQEGSIVRCITRLDELLKDVRNAARVIGNPSLYRKMVAASLCVRRDIVFAASLYIS